MVVMYCVNGASRSTLLIESTDSMIYIEANRCQLYIGVYKKIVIIIISTRASFMKKLQKLLEDDYEDFDHESLDNVEKSSYVLGSELWESKFDGLLSLVKEYIVDL